MDVFLEFAFKGWAALFVAAFVVELVLNRRPVVVALAIVCSGFAGLIAWDWQAIKSEMGQNLVSIYASLTLVGVLPSLAGSGLARFIRLWKSEGDNVDPVRE